MNSLPLFTINLSSNISPGDRTALNNALAFTDTKVQELPQRTGIEEVALVITAISATVEAINLLRDLAGAVIKWRQKLKEKNQEAAAELQHPTKPTLDLKTATDKEIMEWFQQLDL